MGAPPGYRPSAWVHLLHQLPRADFQLRPVPSGFAPQEQGYQQALMLVAALAGLGLALSLIFIAVYLIRFCCCRSPEPPGAKSPPPGGGCVTWSCIAALLVGCAGIGIGFYGNSETSDGVSQLSAALLHANHTLSTIDHLVLETVEGLDKAVRSELTTLEEVLTPRTELVAAARGARRQAEAVAQQLQGLAFWQGVPLSPLQVAEDVSFVEEYRYRPGTLCPMPQGQDGPPRQSTAAPEVAGVRPPAAPGAPGLPLHPPGPGEAEQVAGGCDDGRESPGACPQLGIHGPRGSHGCGSQRLLLQSRHLRLEPDPRGDRAQLRHPELLFPVQPGHLQPLPAEADTVPASSGQHPRPATGPGARSCPPVPICTEASAVLGGDTECDRGKLPPVGGTAALPWPAQGLQCCAARPVRRRSGGPALPAALLPPVCRGSSHHPLQPAPSLGPLHAQESKRFVQWQSSI
ncbi:protein tweety homolog 1 isoform X7 [Heterocephalus glaber]|uniref:Protein tweety homolog n=1 Tax=Heterocephalus glaber TaxID=10181 RepID=A0AAX6S0B3_HETGA|nr:protein tweety homolog 1 isoform X7 [Heterocephalus glaber]